jgi:capsular polysaccharide biosynthesis protein
VTPPEGLLENDFNIFHLQPEHIRWDDPVYQNPQCGVVLIAHNALFSGTINIQSNSTHFYNKDYPYQYEPNPILENLFFMHGHMGYLYQHFVDNIGPQIALISFFISFDKISISTDTSMRNPNIGHFMKNIGFKEVTRDSSLHKASAKNLIFVEFCPRVHPILFQRFHKLFKIPESKIKDKVVYCPRRAKSGLAGGRYLGNENEVIEALRNFYGAENVSVYEHVSSYNDTLSLFMRAKALFGPHGGCLYNSLFASSKLVFVEIMPVINGMYSSQRSDGTGLTFAHMCFWILASMREQTFRRYYVHSQTHDYHIVDLNSFKSFLGNITILFDKY